MTDPYRIGFACGQARAFKDRRAGKWRPPLMPGEVVRDDRGRLRRGLPESEGRIGYRDGYTPRSKGWR